MRVHRAFSNSALVPWAIFLWGAAEIGERLEYISGKETRLREFIMSPVGSVWLVVIGLLSVIVIMIWPNIRQHFEWIKNVIGPSTEDRLKSIEEEVQRLNARWLEEASTRKQAVASERDWANAINGRVNDLKEQVGVLIDDYRKRQA